MLKKLLSILSATIALFTFNVNAAPADIANIPLFLTQPVGVNFMVTIDDSGSMDSEFLPDNLSDTNQLKASANSYNPLAYDPDTKYVIPPWPDIAGTTFVAMPTPLFKAAFFDGYFNQMNTNTAAVDLSKNYQFINGPNNQVAYYAVFDAVATKSVCNQALTAAQQSQLSECYIKVTLDGIGGKTFTIRQPTGCTNSANLACYTVKLPLPLPTSVSTAAEEANFAVWYSYYRKRIQLAKAATLRSVATLPINTRMGCHVLNGNAAPTVQCSKQIDFLREFSGTNQLNLFQRIAKITVGNATPLKDAFRRVGDHFSSSTINSPWAFVPGTTAAPNLECRRSYHMLVTDGYYNGNAAFTGPITTADNTAVTLPDGTPYNGTRAPYAGPDSSTLGDIAFHYWKTNLNPSVPSGKVPTKPPAPDLDISNASQYWDPRNDPASWPHLVNYTVALGIPGTIDKTADNLKALTNGTPTTPNGFKTWPQPVDNTATAIDDLWHAAVNSRGDFFLANDAGDLVKAFGEIVKAIVGDQGSAAGISVTGGTASGNGFAYQSTFKPGLWSGEVVAYPVSPDGSYGSAAWRSSDAGKIKPFSTRVVQTVANSNIVNFTYGNLTAAQQALILGPNVSSGFPAIVDLVGTTNTGSAGPWAVDYYKGDDSKELSVDGSTGYFRRRDTTKLGDILGSGVLYVGGRDYNYSTLSGTAGSMYDAYVTTKKAANPILVAGANDGMVHFFNANTGDEVYSFVPPAIIGNLYKLAQPTYSHSYFVDGQMSESDYFDGTNWRTVVTGSTGLGGTGVFAFDVTNRLSPQLLWYIDSSNFPDIGYGIKNFRVSQLGDGNWYAVFGNGYESSTGQAKLFTVRINSTGYTSTPTVASVAVGVAGANGLSTPTLVKSLNRGYAGDLKGNMWRFDLSSATPAAAFGGKALFTAKNASSQVQPITARPTVYIPKQGGAVVAFGTGQLYKNSDISDLNVQTFYSVWDVDASAASVPYTRTKLAQQTITSQTAPGAARIDRTTSNNGFNEITQRGWYLDLQPPGAAATGERIVTTPLLSFGRIIFTTYIPVTTAPTCKAVSNSFLMSLDAFSGQFGSSPVWDTNGDGVVNSSDDKVAGSAIGGTLGDPTPQFVDTQKNGANNGPPCVKGVACCAPGKTCSCDKLAATECSCGPASSLRGLGDGTYQCVPLDNCGDKMVSVRVSQLGSTKPLSVCMPSSLSSPRMGWREIQ